MPLLEEAVQSELSLAQLERIYIARVLNGTKGNKGKAAKILGLDRRTLYRKVSEMGLGGRGLEEAESE